ncbi:hypothetical protein [Methylobacterium oryzae]|uniref:Uncharacterized protein n=1 Tax=Methylobacterium oryzae TaxID=334852 RepID=A0ABU7TP79_9HYPH
MADRPIIFSAPMIAALLAGRKTQTRRILKPQPELMPGVSDRFHLSNAHGGIVNATEGEVREHGPDFSRFAVGDRLYVRENHAVVPSSAYRMSEGVPQTINPNDRDLAAIYAAGWERSKPRWRPSIHMPRWASRLTLLVTDVRVERLQDISRDDAIAEGATMRPHAYRGGDGWCIDWSPVGRPSRWAADGKALSEEDICFSDPRTAFGSFINVLHDPRWNMKGDGLWGENPWTCAVSFSVHACNIDQLAPIAEAAE